MKLFVYGTLLSSQHRFSLLANINAKFIGNADILAKMYTINREWPFILLPSQQPNEKNTTVVTGEVYELPDKDIGRIDYIEGYNPKNPDNLFVRTTINTLNKQSVFVYVGGPHLLRSTIKKAPEFVRCDALKIEYGDWVAYRRMLAGYSRNKQQRIREKKILEHENNNRRCIFKT
jgi:gamma-glutamylcyclotransferase (GGCT)/AIG2-like uncharacterized protein YtfP